MVLFDVFTRLFHSYGNYDDWMLVKGYKLKTDARQVRHKEYPALFLISDL